MDGEIPSNDKWPPNTYFEGNLLFTKMNAVKDSFFTSISLPAGTEIYYWMVQRKDKDGNETDIWDTGGDSKEFYRLVFTHNGFFNPGYFIFLAGFLPVVLLYFRNKDRQIILNNSEYNLKTYIPQLDSVRAIAVVLVIIHHWVPQKSMLNFLDNGSLGVNIFFVLSGFLITGILLKAKKQVEEQGMKRSMVFKNF